MGSDAVSTAAGGWITRDRALVAFGVLLGWIGLAGLLDTAVDWRAWFELGWMQHWRAAKAALLGGLEAWVGLDLPKALVDYLLVAPIYGVCYFLSMRREGLATGSARFLAIAVSAAVGLFWILSILLLLVSFALSVIAEAPDAPIFYVSVTRYALFFYLSFVALLSVASTLFF